MQSMDHKSSKILITKKWGTRQEKGILPSSAQAQASQSPAGGWDSLILTAVGNHPTTPYTQNSSFVVLQSFSYLPAGR